MVTIAFDKDFLGTIIRIDTPDGKRLIRKPGQESLDIGYLKDFVGTDVKFTKVSNKEPLVDIETAKTLVKLEEVGIDEYSTKKYGRELYYLKFSDSFDAAISECNF